MTEPERRSAPRHRVSVRVWVEGRAGAGRYWFDSFDLSPGGLFLQSDILLEEGEEIGLEFPLPGSGQRLRLRGRVVWVHLAPAADESDRVPGMGIAFEDISTEQRDLIEEAVRTV